MQKIQGAAALDGPARYDTCKLAELGYLHEVRSKLIRAS